EAERAFHGGAADYRRAAEGNQGIAEAIARDLSDVRLRHAVTEVSDDGDDVRVSGDGFSVQARAAVVAVPATIVPTLAFRPALPADQQRALAELPFGVASKFAAATEEPPSPRALQDVDVPYWCWAARGGGDQARSVVAAFAGSPSAQERLRTASGDPSTWMERVRELNPDVAFTGEVVMRTW